MEQFQKNIYVSLVQAFLFLILAHYGKKHIPFALVNLQISQFASDNLRENFSIMPCLLYTTDLVPLIILMFKNKFFGY